MSKGVQFHLERYRGDRARLDKLQAHLAALDKDRMNTVQEIKGLEHSLDSHAEDIRAALDSERGPGGETK